MVELKADEFNADAYAKRYPCRRCGFCCQQAMCLVGMLEAFRRSLISDLHEEIETCPFLKQVGFGFVCEVADDYLDQLAIGAGCCSPLFNTQREAMITSA